MYIHLVCIEWVCVTVEWLNKSECLWDSYEIWGSTYKCVSISLWSKRSLPHSGVQIVVDTRKYSQFEVYKTHNQHIHTHSLSAVKMRNRKGLFDFLLNLHILNICNLNETKDQRSTDGMSSVKIHPSKNKTKKEFCTHFNKKTNIQHISYRL